MVKIVPAIIEPSLPKIEERISTVSGLVPMAQIDVCDGVFVPSETFGASANSDDFYNLRALAIKYGIEIELDMMVQLGAEMSNKWMQAVNISGANRVVFHYGSTDSWDFVFATINSNKIKVGLSVHVDSDLNHVFTLLEDHDFSYVQVMGIENVGYGGQAFAESSLHIIEQLRAKYPEMTISVDGGVNIATAKSLISAGATQLTAGSAIFKADNPQKAIQELVQES